MSSRLRFQHLTCQFPALQTSRVLYMAIHSPLAKETGFPEISGIRGSRIRNTAQGIRNPTNDRNRESKFHLQRTRIRCLKIRNPLRGVQNPRLPWIPLDSLAWGEYTHTDARTNYFV